MSNMSDLWDFTGDSVKSGDCLRDVSPITKMVLKAKSGFIHYVFTSCMFVNPKYSIPLDDLQLFENLLIGGSRSYPSDGKIPVDIAASEAKIILDRIEEISNDPNHPYHKEALEALSLEKNGKHGMVRGTIKLYLDNYTAKDWKRKRFTDDIDFWIFNKKLFEFVLQENGWVKNKKTKEFEKSIKWYNFAANNEENGIIIASNDIEQKLDFGAGSYLEGSTLKDILKKKLKRGHEVDLSDIINVALKHSKENGELNKEWVDAWKAFEESANIRSTRITSNMISLCKYSYGVALHLKRVSKAINKYRKLILDLPLYQIIDIYKNSNQWLSKVKILEINRIRSKIYTELLEQEKQKKLYSKNLRDFASKVLYLLNLKYRDSNVIYLICLKEMK